MRIVIATAVYYPMTNGVAVFSHNLAEGLARRGHEVMVITPSQTGKRYTEVLNNVRTEYLKSITIKLYPDQIHEVPRKRKIGKIELPRVFYEHGLKASVFPGKEISEILKWFLPDVVHVQGSDPIGVATVRYARRHKIPIVTTEHNQPEVFTETLRVPGMLSGPANRILSSYFAKRQMKSDYVTMPTQLSIDYLFKGRQKKPKVPIEAVSNGVDLTYFRPGEVKKEIYEKYGVPFDAPIILYVGRVDPEKKIGVTLRAFKEFLDRVKNTKDEDKIKNDALFENLNDQESLSGEKDSDGQGDLSNQESSTGHEDLNGQESLGGQGDLGARRRLNKQKYEHKLDALSKTLFLVVGDGVDKNRLMNEAERLGISESVKFLGKILPPELYEIYRLGDVFVTASEIETQGIVLIEAAATGLPLIAVNAGAVSEVCRDAENGFLLEPGDYKGMSDAMFKILSDAGLRRKFSQRSMMISGEHSLEETVDRFVEIYEKVRKSKKNAF